jgi:hypothetical protein
MGCMKITIVQPTVHNCEHKIRHCLICEMKSSLSLVTLNYRNVIGDYIVGYLFKNTRWVYFTLLQLIFPCINVCRFTNQSWSSGYKCPLLRRNTVLSISWRRSVPAHSCRAHNRGPHDRRFHFTINFRLPTGFTTHWSLSRLLLQHWARSLRELAEHATGPVRRSSFSNFHPVLELRRNDANTHCTHLAHALLQPWHSKIVTTAWWLIPTTTQLIQQ